MHIQSNKIIDIERWGENGQPSAQRANVALILAAIKSTRLVANANWPTGPKTSLPSQSHPTTKNQPNPLPLIAIQLENQLPYFHTPVDLVDW